jgi:hypothetical protein
VIGPTLFDLLFGTAIYLFGVVVGMLAGPPPVGRRRDERSI